MVRFMNLTSVEAALKIIENRFSHVTEVETVPLGASGGRILAETITASEDIPGFDRSIVDGYALRACETHDAGENTGILFRLAGEVVMGRGSPEIGSGECCYVPTGGMLPSGADAVVMIEQTEAEGEQIRIFRRSVPGENRLMRGEDFRCGEMVMTSGARLRAPEIGVLASLGITGVKVFRQPRVIIFSTGDELAPPDTPKLQPGTVRDSNGPALQYLAEQKGAMAMYRGILPDDRQAFRKRLGEAGDEADLVVLSGGSSVGHRDYTPEVLKELTGGELLLEGLAIQPGKPTLLAEHSGKAWLGLPGHPISALTVFSLLGNAILRRLSGISEPDVQPYVQAVLTRNVPSRPGRLEWVRVRLEGDGDGLKAIPVFGRSGLLSSLARADGLIRIAPASDGLMAGEIINVYPWR
jgi:molybdopterin molybdotransferase